MGPTRGGWPGVLKFDSLHWSEEIAQETEKPEYQTCEIQIVDPKLISEEYNYDTGEYESAGDGVIYSGRARLIAVRRGVNYEGTNQNNSKTISAIRIQIPSRELQQTLRKGCTARVTSAPMNRTLEGCQLYLASDVHGSSAATRTFEFNMDGDSVNG